MRKSKLGSILKIKHGFAFKSENYIEIGNVALVTLANFSESNNFKFNLNKTTFYGANYPEEYNLYEGDLVVPLTEQMVGLFGNTAFIPKIDGLQFVLNQRVGKVLLNKNVDPNFIHFLLSTKSVRDQLEARASAGTKQRNISPEDIYDVVVSLPEYKEQQKIGKCLYLLENIINNNNELNKLLENTIKDIYNYWFLQFDFPNTNGLPYKSNGGELVYNKEIKRNIPLDWKVESFFSNSITEIIKPGVDYFTHKNYLATKNINENVIVDGEWISFDNRENRANMQPKKNTVWFAKMKNSIKHVSVTDSDDWFIEKYILSTGFLGLQCTKNSFSYIRSVIYSDLFEFVKNRISHGNTQEAVNNEDLNYIALVIPTDEVLEKFAEVVYPIIRNINNNIKVNQELKELQDFLLPLLMNGQIIIS